MTPKEIFNRYSAYRVMWIMVLFDLPTETKVERRAASLFRESLLKDGFKMFQFSIYMRHCASREKSKVHIKRVKEKLPKKGKVCIFEITDKQHGMMELFHGTESATMPEAPEQLTMF